MKGVGRVKVEKGSFGEGNKALDCCRGNRNDVGT